MIKSHRKLIHEGDYLAEVEVELTDAQGGWAPYLSVTDVRRLDDVRLALRRGDLKMAGRLAKVYRLTPITAA